VPKHRRLLGDAIRDRRKHMGLTQETMAEKAGLSVVFISLLENGHRTISVDSLLKIARVLNVDLKNLMAGIK
jgi:y4mF family transcriptional regulator